VPGMPGGVFCVPGNPSVGEFAVVAPVGTIVDVLVAPVGTIVEVLVPAAAAAGGVADDGAVVVVVPVPVEAPVVPAVVCAWTEAIVPVLHRPAISSSKCVFIIVSSASFATQSRAGHGRGARPDRPGKNAFVSARESASVQLVPRMTITGLALVPPPSAADLPKVTPELLASVLARYSRSNEGLAAILSKVDVNNPDASIDRILKFVDYGHASIGGLTGGLAIALDGVSMWLAYKIFEVAQMADGQESSTRYITMDATNLPAAEEVGIPSDLAPRWRDVLARAFAAYHAEYARLDALATAEPQRVRVPADAKPAVVARLRKNYALDRARYFVPFATRTNLGLVQSSRMWSMTVKHLDSLPHPEARAAAKLIRDELLKQSPRLMRHSAGEPSYEEQARQELATSLALGRERLSAAALPDEAWVHVERAAPPWLGEMQPLAEALRHRANRYGQQGTATRRMRVTFAWNNLALAELRDLNRHRTGNRYTPLIQAGFYLPPEIDRRSHAALLDDQLALTRELLERSSPAYVYSLLLGAQTPFEHSTHADKFIYEAELRTGMGAHFRYAEHLSAALKQFFAQVPEARSWVVEGTAEPE
jgi:thymidylate synthase ThyX